VKAERERNEIEMGILDIFKSNKNTGNKANIEALKELGYSENYIVKNKMESLSHEDVELLKADEEIRLVSEVLVKAKKMNFVEAFTKVRNAQENFGLKPSIYAFNGLYRKNDEVVREFVEKREAKQKRAVKRIAQVAGWTLEKSKEETERAYEKFGVLPMEYYTELYYNLTDDEIAAKKEEEEKELQRCIDWVKSETGWTDYEVKLHRYYCRLAFGIVAHAYFPTRCWQMDDKTLKTFARQRDSKKLRDKYNDNKHNALLANKVKFNMNFGELTGRKFWLNRDTSYEEFLEFVDGLDVLFCKPVNLSHAAGTRKVKVEGDLRALYEDLISQPKTLVEECVKQHHEMNEFYDNSVNTVRIFCVLDNDKFVPLAGFVRFGANGVADNIVAGGVGCGLDVETGTIDTMAIDKWHDLHETHPVSGKKFEGFKIPNWDLVLEAAERGLRHIEGINYVGWDIAVCEDKAVLIEGNTLPSISTYQMFYGYKHEGKRYRFKKYLDSVGKEVLKSAVKEAKK